MRDGRAGHLWQVRWSNPYTEPPAGMPRVLAEMFMPPACLGAAGRCPQEIGAYPRPRGYCLACLVVAEPLVPLPPERLAKLRRQRLERRERERHPLFAEQFVAERLAAQPDYYAGMDNRPEREAVLAAERERYEYLTAHPNELLVYWRGEVGDAA